MKSTKRYNNSNAWLRIDTGMMCLYRLQCTITVYVSCVASISNWRRGLRLFFIRLSSIFCPIYSRIYSFHVSRRIFRDVQKRHSIWKSAFHWQCFSFQYQMTGANRPHRTRECRGVELGEEIEMYDNSNRKHTKTTLGISLTTKNTASNGNSSNQCFFFFFKRPFTSYCENCQKKIRIYEI